MFGNACSGKTPTTRGIYAMITDELAMKAKAGDKAAMTAAFKDAEKYAERNRLPNVSLEFLEALKTWNPERGPFWSRLLFKLHRSHDYVDTATQASKYVAIDLTRLVVNPKPRKSCHAGDVREAFQSILSRLSETAQCLFVCLTKTPNQHTAQFGVEDYVYNARYWTAYRMDIEFSETLAAWDELQPLVAEYTSILEEVA